MLDDDSKYKNVVGASVCLLILVFGLLCIFNPSGKKETYTIIDSHNNKHTNLKMIQCGINSCSTYSLTEQRSITFYGPFTKIREQKQ